MIANFPIISSTLGYGKKKISSFDRKSRGKQEISSPSNEAMKYRSPAQ